MQALTKLTFATVSLLLLFSGCSSLQPVSSNEENLETAYEYRFYDESSKIRYQITNDQEYLYVRLNTNNRFAIHNILRSGLFFYFDVEGKKNKDTFFQYPLNTQGSPYVNRNREKPEQGKRPKMNVADMIEHLPTKAIFSKNENKEHIELLSTEKDVEVKLTSNDRNDELYYYLKIPFSKIHEDGFNAISKLSVCIEAEKIKMQKGNRGNKSGKMRAGGGGGMKMGRGGKGMGKGRRSGRQQASKEQTIEFWTKIEFEKEAK